MCFVSPISEADVVVRIAQRCIELVVQAEGLTDHVAVFVSGVERTDGPAAVRLKTPAWIGPEEGKVFKAVIDAGRNSVLTIIQGERFLQNLDRWTLPDLNIGPVLKR